MKIEQVNQDHKGYFKASENDKEAGRMTYTWTGTDRIIIDHTEVSPDFRGRNVGEDLLMGVVSFARENNIKIIPLCPYARSVFDKKKELADVL